MTPTASASGRASAPAFVTTLGLGDADSRRVAMGSEAELRHAATEADFRAAAHAAELALLGPEHADRLGAARRLRTEVPSIPLLVVCASPTADEVRGQFRFFPVAGDPPIVMDVDGDVAAMVEQLRERRRLRAEHERAIAAAGARLQQAEPRKPPASAYYDRLVEHLPIGVVSTDAAGGVKALNHAARILLHRHGEPARTLEDLASGAARAALRALHSQALLASGQATAPVRIDIDDDHGEAVVLEALARRIDGLGADGGVTLILSDVTARVRAEDELRVQRETLATIIEGVDQGISMVDAELNAVAFNSRFLELLDFPPGQFQAGTPFEAFIRHNAERGEYGPGDVDEQVSERLRAARSFEPHRFERTRPDGTVIEVRGTPLPGGGFVTTYTDVTDERRLSRQLSYEASHDSLTGLSNRRGFEARLGELLGRDRDADSRHALCYIDLDRFKLVNDTLGHAAGDDLLRELASLMHDAVRKDDMLARLGGDEFAILLADCPLERATRVAEDMRSRAAHFRFSRDGHTFSIGMSIGVVAVGAEFRTLDEVLSAADAACYAAKAGGRNLVHVLRPGDDAVGTGHAPRR